MFVTPTETLLHILEVALCSASENIRGCYISDGRRNQSRQSAQNRLSWPEVRHTNGIENTVFFFK